MLLSINSITNIKFLNLIVYLVLSRSCCIVEKWLNLRSYFQFGPIPNKVFHLNLVRRKFEFPAYNSKQVIQMCNLTHFVGIGTKVKITSEIMQMHLGNDLKNKNIWFTKLSHPNKTSIQSQHCTLASQAHCADQY